MDLQLNGKTALVTGGSKGIGLATVRQLIAEGARVAAISRTLTDELRDTGAIHLFGDLSLPGTADEVVAQAIAALGSLDILINNLGGGDGNPGQGFLDFDDTVWDTLLSVNLLAAVRTTRAAMPELLRTHGVVVNVSSDAADRPQTAPLPYSAAKAATNAFSMGLSEEMGPRGVRVTTVSPAFTRTALWEGEDTYAAALAARAGVTLDQLVAALPTQMGMTTGRIIEADEVASVIAYVASPVAGSVLGTNWAIDGGIAKHV